MSIPEHHLQDYGAVGKSGLDAALESLTRQGPPPFQPGNLHWLAGYETARRQAMGMAHRTADMIESVARPDLSARRLANDIAMMRPEAPK